MEGWCGYHQGSIIFCVTWHVTRDTWHVTGHSVSLCVVVYGCWSPILSSPSDVATCHPVLWPGRHTLTSPPLTLLVMEYLGWWIHPYHIVSNLTWILPDMSRYKRKTSDKWVVSVQILCPLRTRRRWWGEEAAGGGRRDDTMNLEPENTFSWTIWTWKISTDKFWFVTTHEDDILANGCLQQAELYEK